MWTEVALDTHTNRPDCYAELCFEQKLHNYTSIPRCDIVLLQVAERMWSKLSAEKICHLVLKVWGARSRWCSDRIVFILADVILCRRRSSRFFSHWKSLEDIDTIRTKSSGSQHPRVRLKFHERHPHESRLTNHFVVPLQQFTRFLDSLVRMCFSS